MNKTQRLINSRNYTLQKMYKSELRQITINIQHNNECIKLYGKMKNKYGQYEYIGLVQENLEYYKRLKLLKKLIEYKPKLSGFFTQKSKELQEVIDENRIENLIQEDREVYYINPYESFDGREMDKRK